MVQDIDSNTVELGFSTSGGPIPFTEAFHDYNRIDYLCSHLCFLRKAIKWVDATLL